MDKHINDHKCMILPSVDPSVPSQNNACHMNSVGNCSNACITTSEANEIQLP